ncbi:hypothetical protein [Nocardia acidivorans]|uniref:hypothetical protein n=1 Tax=Nocardia acidivorans TaxID=404580 RepID=UPI000829BBD8|nr:hypothetical protein [Nocardia acidivorans]
MTSRPRSRASASVPEAARPNAFGHPGAGGSIGLGDLAHGVALAFTPNPRRGRLARGRRADQLVEAVYAAL